MGCLGILGLDKTLNYIRVLCILWIGDQKWSTMEVFKFLSLLVLGFDTLCSPFYSFEENDLFIYVLWFCYLSYHTYCFYRCLEYSLPTQSGRNDNSKYTSPRWIRRHRRRKPPFITRDNHSHTKESNTRAAFDLVPNIPYWKLLHKVGDFLGREFDELYKRNNDIMYLFGSDSKFNISRHSMKDTNEVFSFHIGSEVMLDLTKLTDTGNVFRFQSIYHINANGPPIIFDSGASITISPNRDDFITYSNDVGKTSLSGITTQAVCTGRGKARFNVVSDDGSIRSIETETLHVPNARVRLLSVQRYCMKTKDGSSFTVDESGCKFRFPKKLGGGVLTFDLEGEKMLPQTSVIKQWGRRIIDKNRIKHKAFTVVSTDNLNLDNGQKVLLEWHWKLGHYNMKWIQFLITKGFIKARHSNSFNAKCLCAACQLAKQTRKPEGTIRQSIRREKDGGLKKEQLAVGGKVSTDQFVSSLPGRLPHTFGKEKQHEQFTGGTIFIDEASEFFFIQNQISLGAAETVRAKNTFERQALRHGVSIRSYRGDNGVYKSAAFKKSCDSMNQTFDYSGIGAHHHNGIAERGIRTVSTCARTMLLHAMIHWPEETELNLWPFAVDYAVYLWNLMPREKSGLSPTELFYATKSNHEELQNAKVWGCPVYVLDPTLQDGKKLPRWQPRSRLGQFLGRSKSHASSVGLIKNIATGKVTSQFHVVYDDHFSTLPVNKRTEIADLPKEWENLFVYNREKHFDDSDLETLRKDKPQNRRHLPPVVQVGTEMVPNSEQPVDVGTEGAEGGQSGSSPPSPQANSPTEVPVVTDTPASPSSDAGPRRSRRLASLPPTHTPLANPHRPKSSALLSEEYVHFLDDFHKLSHHDAFLIDSDLNTRQDSLTKQYDVLHMLCRDDFDEDLQLGTHPFAFAAKANAEDTPTFNEAMSSPDREGFIEAMKKELDALDGMEAWDVVPREKAIKTGRKIIASTWAFKRKRYPDGTVKKLKARLVARGDQQVEGVDYFDSFSPVVQWSTIRLLLVLSMMLNLKSVQVDYTLAFVQAPAENNVFVEMPRMFDVPGYVFELKRNLYGLCEAPRNFFQHLKKGLNDRGLKNSKYDHCMFYSDKIIVVVYVDDCIFMAKDEEDINRLIEDLRKPENSEHEEYVLNKEEDYAGFLGIDIRKSKEIEGAIELLQIGLIDRILKVLSLDGENTKLRWEPAASTPLGKHEEGPGRKEHWSYASVIGMMIYLSSNSRPDIAFAVHQCARFTHCANNQHEIAIKRIGRYLKATREQGLIMKPNEDLRLDLYADADFAGLWAIENKGFP